MAERRILNTDDLTDVNADVSVLEQGRINKIYEANYTSVTYLPGFFKFDDGSGAAALPLSITKNISGPWVAGTTQPGYDVAGNPGIGIYVYVFGIYNPTSKVTDVLLSSSLTSPTMPAGFTKKGRIDVLHINTPAGTEHGIRQTGKWYWRDVPLNAYNGTVVGMTVTPPYYLPLNIPGLIRPVAIIDVIGDRGLVDYELYFSDASATVSTHANFKVTGSAPDNESNNVRFFIPIASDAGIIRIDVISGGSSNGNLQIWDVGWIDHKLQ